MEENRNNGIELDIGITLDEALNMIYQRDKDLLFAKARIKQLENEKASLEAELNSFKK